jgi:hypothetical protein
MTRYKYDDYDEDGGKGQVELSDESFLHEMLYQSFYELEKGSVKCPKRSPDDEWTCTRIEGHQGPHIGHNNNPEIVGVWPNEDSEICTLDDAWDYDDVIYDKEEEDDEDLRPVEVIEGRYDPYGWIPEEE